MWYLNLQVYCNLKKRTLHITLLMDFKELGEIDIFYTSRKKDDDILSF